jgi:hypothetical protein
MHGAGLLQVPALANPKFRRLLLLFAGIPIAATYLWLP